MGHRGLSRKYTKHFISQDLGKFLGTPNPKIPKKIEQRLGQMAPNGEETCFCWKTAWNNHRYHNHYSAAQFLFFPSSPASKVITIHDFGGCLNSGMGPPIFKDERLEKLQSRNMLQDEPPQLPQALLLLPRTATRPPSACHPLGTMSWLFMIGGFREFLDISGRSIFNKIIRDGRLFKKWRKGPCGSAFYFARWISMVTSISWYHYWCLCCEPPFYVPHYFVFFVLWPMDGVMFNRFNFWLNFIRGSGALLLFFLGIQRGGGTTQGWFRSRSYIRFFCLSLFQLPGLIFWSRPLFSTLSPSGLKFSRLFLLCLL